MLYLRFCYEVVPLFCPIGTEICCSWSLFRVIQAISHIFRQSAIEIWYLERKKSFFPFRIFNHIQNFCLRSRGVALAGLVRWIFVSARRKSTILGRTVDCVESFCRQSNSFHSIPFTLVLHRTMEYLLFHSLLQFLDALEPPTNCILPPRTIESGHLVVRSRPFPEVP